MKSTPREYQTHRRGESLVAFRCPGCRAWRDIDPEDLKGEKIVRCPCGWAHKIDTRRPMKEIST